MGIECGWSFTHVAVIDTQRPQATATRIHGFALKQPASALESLRFVCAHPQWMCDLSLPIYATAFRYSFAALELIFEGHLERGRDVNRGEAVNVTHCSADAHSDLADC